MSKTRSTKARKRKIWRKELSGSWSKGAHRALKLDALTKKDLTN